MFPRPPSLAVVVTMATIAKREWGSSVGKDGEIVIASETRDGFEMGLVTGKEM